MGVLNDYLRNNRRNFGRISNQSLLNFLAQLSQDSLGFFRCFATDVDIKYFAEFVLAKLNPLKVGQVAVVSQSANYFGKVFRYFAKRVDAASKTEYISYRSISDGGNS